MNPETFDDLAYAAKETRYAADWLEKFVIPESDNMRIRNIIGALRTCADQLDEVSNGSR